MDGLVRNFSNYFSPRYAATRHQKRFGYTIRYQVYTEELGWEPPNEKCLERDECDDYSHHCLLEHKRTGEIAGCVRLVIPPSDDTQAQLPFQHHDINLPSNNHLNHLNQGRFGEISRLAVPRHFRRRANEAGKPFVLGSYNPSVFTEEDQRNFPNISIGLYLSAIAMVDISQLDLVVVVMEPRLQRHLKRFGLHFRQISTPFELRGKRALYDLQRSELTCHMSPQIKSLYDFIRNELENQPWKRKLSSGDWRYNDRL
ncbi:MAG: PEP-CTERM/exosortase system-associated acyltransferase [Candidatus Thiodiazotropha sp.]|jgi:N-acyl amino acid synthase of PEP-CTERM/exosortase system